MTNAENRAVHTDALQTLGSIIGEGEKRDAIHLAVEPAVAAGTVYPGQHVGFVAGGFGPTTKTVGIVDPFIKGAVYEGQRFWLILYPRQITSLRHVWEHPDFDIGGQGMSRIRESQMWLEHFAVREMVELSELLKHAEQYAMDGDYWVEGGRFEGHSVPEEFWDHYEAVTGKTAARDRGNFFSCSC